MSLLNPLSVSDRILFGAQCVCVTDSWLCLQLAHATEMKEDEDKGDRGTHLFALSLPNQCFGFFSFLNWKSCYVNHQWKNFSVSEHRRSLLCLHDFIFCLDLYDNEDEINEHQPFPSLSQVIGFSYLLHPIYYITVWTSLFNVSVSLLLFKSSLLFLLFLW